MDKQQKIVNFFQIKPSKSKDTESLLHCLDFTFDDMEETKSISYCSFKLEKRGCKNSRKMSETGKTIDSFFTSNDIVLNQSLLSKRSKVDPNPNPTPQTPKPAFNKVKMTIDNFMTNQKITQSSHMFS